MSDGLEQLVNDKKEGFLRFRYSLNPSISVMYSKPRARSEKIYTHKGKVLSLHFLFRANATTATSIQQNAIIREETKRVFLNG